jgi:glyoxylase I family protein
LRSTDVSAAAAFYVTHFGAIEAGRAVMGGAPRLNLTLHGLRVIISEVPQTTPAAPAPPFRGLEHIGLLVGNLEQALRSLTASGVRVAEGIKAAGAGVSVAFVEGPDGVLIELVQRD